MALSAEAHKLRIDCGELSKVSGWLEGQIPERVGTASNVGSRRIGSIPCLSYSLSVVKEDRRGNSAQEIQEPRGTSLLIQALCCRKHLSSTQILQISQDKSDILLIDILPCI